MISRSLFIGENFEATASFFEDGIPIQPLNPSISPTHVISDINGDLVLGGVGTFSPIDNLYHMSGNIPEDSILSSDDAKYVITWDLLGTNNKEYKSIEYFDVVSPVYNMTTSKEQQKFTLTFAPLTLSIPLPSIPSVIELLIYDINNNVILTVTPVSLGIYSDYYIYTFTIPANTFSDNYEYAAVWSFTLGGEESVFYQKIQCGNLFAMSRISDLRMRADKFQKDIDLYTGYRDSDLYFHLYNGLDYLNMLFIPTNWTMMSIKSSGFPMFPVIDCALLSLLRAQYLAEGDVSFDYSGQPVSLTIDRTAFLEAEIGRLQEEIEAKIIPWKKQVIKRSQNFCLGLTAPSVSNNVGSRSPAIRNWGIPFRPLTSWRS